MKFGQSEAVIDPGWDLPKELVPTINTIIAETLKRDEVHLVWTSLQLNLNTVSDWHQDWGNVGPSAIGALGTYSGGEFQVQDCPPMTGSWWSSMASFVIARSPFEE